MKLPLSPVGYVRNAIKERSRMGLGGVVSAIEILPKYRKAMQGLSEASHIWVIAYLQGADRSVLKARPRKISSALAERGVFAMRSPDRPNPVAITCARIAGMRGLRIALDSLDFIDGTPVLDIKPYSSGIDSVPAAAHPDYSSKYALMPDAALAVTLRRILRNHFLKPGQAHMLAGALVLKYIRASGRAPSHDAGAILLRGGCEKTAMAVEALFGCGARCKTVSGRGAASLVVASGRKRVAVSCVPSEARAFAKLGEA